MEAILQSAGERVAATSRAARNTDLTVREAIDAYMTAYAGRDTTRAQRLAWWSSRLGDMRVIDVGDDDIFFALEDLADWPGRYYAGKDADGKPIFKAKKGPRSPATVNRYKAAIAAVFTWSIKRRLTPRGWVNPCRQVEARAERNEIVRFLSEDERKRLLAACRASRWSRLYLLVLMALTTGARRGELLGLRGRDLDLDQGVAYVERSKNGDRKTLPLVPAVLEELRPLKVAPSSLLFASKRRPDVAFNFGALWSQALKDARVKNFRFHDLRHTCASYLAQHGATLLEIAEVLGHRQLSVTRRYSHLTTGHKARLVERVMGEIR
jgi:integrase